MTEQQSKQLRTDAVAVMNSTEPKRTLLNYSYTQQQLIKGYIIGWHKPARRVQ